MVAIAGDTCEKLDEYIEYMTDTASSMLKMRETATETENSIERLQAAMDEVSEFAQTMENTMSCGKHRHSITHSFI